MKPLLMAAALNEGTVTQQTKYYDQGYVQIKGRVFTNAINYPPQTRSVQDILSYSLNTGGVYLLKSLGDGSINKQAQDTWYNYLTNHYNFGHETGIELPDESSGEVRPPSGGRFIETQYAGSAFGVGLTVTPLQLTCAYAAIVNGGTYYKPHVRNKSDKPEISIQNVVSARTSNEIREMLEKALSVNNPTALRNGYVLGGKSGTAPVASEGGVYKIGSDNGAYIGFVGKDRPKYIVLVKLDEPHTTNFASAEAKKVWATITNSFIDKNLIY
jgi:cell division protein FtsI/penicillin-binding protein 2